MALMVLGAVRLRTWARPERVRGVRGHVAVSRGKAGWDRSRPGKSWIGEERCGAVCHGREARVVVGQVRFLTRARPERALGGVTPGKALRGKAPMGAARQVLGGALDGRRWGSTPHRGAARKRSCSGTAGLGMAWQGGARQGKAGQGKAWERYWQTPGFKSPERTASKEVLAGARRGVVWRPEARQGKEHNGGPGPRNPRPPQARQLTHPGGYQ